MRVLLTQLNHMTRSAFSLVGIPRRHPLAVQQKNHCSGGMRYAALYRFRDFLALTKVYQMKYLSFGLVEIPATSFFPHPAEKPLPWSCAVRYHSPLLYGFIIS